MGKKKVVYLLDWFLRLQFVLLFFMVLSICLNFGSEVQAITQDDILSALSQFKNNYPKDGRNYENVINNFGDSLVNLSSEIYSHYVPLANPGTIEQQNIMVIYTTVDINNNFSCFVSLGNTRDIGKLCYINRQLAILGGSSYYLNPYSMRINNGVIDWEGRTTELYVFRNASNYDFLMVFPISNFYSSYSSTTPVELNSLFSNLFNSTGYFNGITSDFTNPNSITINAQNIIKYKAHIDNQATISVLGEWNIIDFNYYIQRKENGIYHTLSDECDYSLINNNEYDNAYLYCKNINYLPYGTYRFIAISEVLGLSAFSSDFLLTYETVNNSATGTVDNGNIEINIDTGETVDNIKDYLGQPANTTEDEFKDNFPTVEVDDPSEDFFSWIFNQIENVFLSTSPEVFEFSLYTGNVYRINSNDIKVPDGIIKTLIGLSCDFSICYWIMKDVRKVINKIKEGNIEALADEDITANMV